MSILNLLTESLYNEVDELDINADEPVVKDEPAPEEAPAPAPEEKTSTEGNPKALVDSLIKYAPGKEKQIKNMLKYAANSGQEYDIFDSAYDYFESIEKDFKNADTEEPTEDIPVDDGEDLPLGDEEPTDENELDLSGL